MIDAELSSAEEFPGRSAKLTSFQDEREVSAGFYPDQLGLFLWRLVPHIQEDFGGDQIHRLIRVADSMALEETREIPIMVSFRGRRVPFRVRVYKYSAETSHAVAIYVKTSSALAGVFEQELKVFFSPPSGELVEGEQPVKSHRTIHLRET